MKTCYIAVADHAHLRIFAEQTEVGQTTPGLEEVYALDFPQGKASYAANEADFAGRFQGSKQQGASPGAPGARTGMSIDERLPLQRETERRNLDDIAEALGTFLTRHPGAGWDFAAGPSAHNAILDRLPEEIRARLRRSLPKDLVNQPTAGLLARFERQA